MAIYLDKEGVEAVVSKIDQAIEDLQTIAAAIDNQVAGEMGSYWQGQAYNKTIDTYETNYRPMLTKDLPETVEQLKEFINQCKEAIVEVDNQLSGNA